MCRRLSARDDARCRRSRWAGAISRAHPPRGTRDRLSPAWSTGRGADERCWARWFSSHGIDATDAAADQPAGIGRMGMTSTDSPGKIVKWGWFSNSLAAAACESARTTAKAPMTETAAWCFSTQAFQAAMPSCSLARRSASGSAVHAFMRGLVLLPRKTARYVLFVVMRFPFLYGLWAETRVRNSGVGARRSGSFT